MNRKDVKNLIREKILEVKIKGVGPTGRMSKEFTVIDSYSSRNDTYDYMASTVVASSARGALVGYLVSTGLEYQEAVEWVSEIEQRFTHDLYSNGVEVWATDDPFYIVAPGILSNNSIGDILDSYHS